MKKSEYSRVRAKWRRWIRRISDSASVLLLDDYIFRKSMEAAQKGGVVKSSNEVYRWAMRVYATHASIGIRRLLDKDVRTYSLFLLLSKIEKNPQVITRRSFVFRYSSSRRGMGMGDFDKIAGPNSISLPRHIVQTDLDKLVTISNKIRPIVNKVMAHRERKTERITKPTWGELHNAIEQIAQMSARYQLILNQESTTSMLPSINAIKTDHDVTIIWR
ncbi:MAG: hypothetical protein KAT29_13195 [Anaerolineales bacterium]|nr:hypothetical protein [Anaerolineales bacterium]